MVSVAISTVGSDSLSVLSSSTSMTSTTPASTKFKVPGAVIDASQDFVTGELTLSGAFLPLRSVLFFCGLAGITVNSGSFDDHVP
jgi:hypothetical protein